MRVPNTLFLYTLPQRIHAAVKKLLCSCTLTKVEDVGGVGNGEEDEKMEFGLSELTDEVPSETNEA